MSRISIEQAQELSDFLSANAGSPTQAMLGNVLTETLGMAMYNSVTTQQNAQMLNNASTTSTCSRILNTFSLPGKPAPPPTSFDFKVDADVSVDHVTGDEYKVTGTGTATTNNDPDPETGEPETGHHETGEPDTGETH